MIVTSIFISLLILGIIFGILAHKTYWDNMDFLSILGVSIGSIGLLICLIMIMAAHIYTPKTIQTNKLQYDGLCKRLEVVQSNYEDVSKSQVIADITAWNTEVYDTKYWTESPWTNWFNPREIADNLDYIPLE